MRTLLQLAFVVFLSTTVLAQWANVPAPQIPRTADGKPNLSAPAPRLPDGTPDLSGVWSPPTGYSRDLARDLKEGVPFQPWAKTLYDERASGSLWKEEPDANCLPQGVPKVLLVPAVWRIVQTPKIVFFVHEAFNLWWQAFTDGRRFVPHEDVAPTWHGYSTAKWDGDTLVVDVTNINDDPTRPTWLDASGNYHSDALHVEERYTFNGPNMITYRARLEDPKVYRQPFTIEVTLYRHMEKNFRLMDYECQVFKDKLVREGKGDHLRIVENN